MRCSSPAGGTCVTATAGIISITSNIASSEARSGMEVKTGTGTSAQCSSGRIAEPLFENTRTSFRFASIPTYQPYKNNIHCDSLVRTQL